MNHRTIVTAGVLFAVMLFGGSRAFSAPVPTNGRAIFVQVETTLGNFTLELYPEKVPKTVENFLAYVDDGYYKRTIFHRVIDNFVIQGGAYEAKTGKEKPARSPIKNESSNGLSNKRGTIAVARGLDPDSGTSQFFINQKDNPFLDADNFRDKVGHCVFGKVIEGMDVIDKIAGVKTSSQGNLSDVPTEEVIIFSIRRLKR